MRRCDARGDEERNCKLKIANCKFQIVVGAPERKRFDPQIAQITQIGVAALAGLLGLCGGVSGGFGLGSAGSAVLAVGAAAAVVASGTGIFAEAFAILAGLAVRARAGAEDQCERGDQKHNGSGSTHGEKIVTGHDGRVRQNSASSNKGQTPRGSPPLPRLRRAVISAHRAAPAVGIRSDAFFSSVQIATNLRDEYGKRETGRGSELPTGRISAVGMRNEVLVYTNGSFGFANAAVG